MNVTTTVYFDRDGVEIEATIEATVSGERGRIEEICDVVAKCACGAVLALTPDEERKALDALAEQSRAEVEAWLEDQAESYGEDARDRARGL